MLIQPQEGEDGESLHAAILIAAIYILHYLAEE